MRQDDEAMDVLLAEGYRQPPPPVRDKGPAMEMNFSVVAQMDRLCHALLGLRIERDVYATSAEQSVCALFGLRSFISCSTFCGFYFPPVGMVEACVKMLQEHHAIGVLVYPVGEEREGRLDASGGSWEASVGQATILLFTFPQEVVFPRQSMEFRGAVVNFGFIGRMKSKRRPESCFFVDIVPELDLPPRKIGVIPTILTQASPLAGQLAPTRNDDILLGDPPLRPGGLDAPDAPRQAPSSWDVALMKSWARGYPHQRVASLAMEAVGKGVNPFVGDISKTVVSKCPPLNEAAAVKCRQKLLEGKENAYVSGPFSHSPFGYGRVCPMFSVAKNKYDPECDEIRLVNHFSRGVAKAGSVNALCFSPKPIAFHCRASHLRDVMANLGCGTRVWAADIPKCFRRLRIHEDILRLFIYVCETKEFGKEWWVDRSCPFGWAPSEWGWQMVLAIIMWKLRKEGFPDTLAYVDNFFDFSSPAGGQEAFVRRTRRLRSILAEAGIPLHEEQVGTRFRGLGWLWDTESMMMVCPEDKFAYVCTCVVGWAAAVSLSLKDLEKAVGILHWLSSGFPIGRAAVGHLVHDRTRAQAIAVRRSLPAERTVVRISKASRAALQFWATALPKWNRECPIVAGFTPVNSWEVLGRYDASTDWGCGGFIVLPRTVTPYLLYFTHEWSPEERSAAMRCERESTGLLDLMGAARWLECFAPWCSGRRVQLEGDNAAATLGLQAAYSPLPSLLNVIETAMGVCVRNRITPRFCHVVGVRFNCIADCLSHDDIAQAQWHAGEEFGRALLRA